VEIRNVPIRFPEDSNIILGQSHFIKTVEDLYEAMVSLSPTIKFGIAFAEASGPCLVRHDGNDDALESAAVDIVNLIGAGHSFAIVMKEGFPINVLNAVKSCQEVCRIYCATANPLEVVVAESPQGKGILGVIDGESPKGIEGEEDIRKRKDFLKMIGYKR